MDISTLQKPIRIYTDGCFDCFHIGHARLLQQCKQKFKHVYLMVGVSPQSDINKYKGTCVQNDFERTEVLKHCKWTDEVIFPCPWVITKEFMQENQIDYVMHDEAPYSTGNTQDIYGPIKQMGKFIATQRTENISTTDLITRIIRDRDLYITRNLKKGHSNKELNLNFIEQIYYKFFIGKFSFCQKRKKD